MTIQHKDIPDINLHEPKGIATAIVNKSYIANGAGSGAWRHNIGSVHGEIYLDTAAISVGPTGGTITTDANYRVIGPTWVLNPDTYNTALHSSNQAIQVSVTGHYALHSYISFTTGAVAAGVKYALKYRKNNSATLSTRKLVTSKVTAGADSLFISGSTFTMLTAGDYIDLMVGSSAIDTITVTDAGVSLFLMHEV